ncbi:MAG: LytR C-terminal domain-containing protein [Bacteroidota bacterium]
MAQSRLTDGLLNVALVVGGVVVLVLLYGFASRTFLPRTTPTRAGTEAAPTANSRIKVEVRNGAGVNGLAAEATAHLRRRGFDVVEVGNATPADTSRVLVRSGTALDARHVAQALGLGPEAVQTGGPINDYSLDVTVTLGADYPDRAPFDLD